MPSPAIGTLATIEERWLTGVDYEIASFGNKSVAHTDRYNEVPYRIATLIKEDQVAEIDYQNWDLGDDYKYLALEGYLVTSGAAIIATGTEYSFAYTSADKRNYKFQVMGTGFIFDEQGNPIAGTITGIRVMLSGLPDKELIVATGIQKSLKAFFDQLSNGPKAALDVIFAGNDKTIGSVYGDHLVSNGAPEDRDTLDGGAGDDSIFGGQGFDLLLGGMDHDYLNGGDSNDTLDGGAGNDLLDGGNGWDMASYATAAKGVHVSLRDGKAYEDGFGTQDELVRIEHLTGSAYDDRLIGDDIYNEIRAGAGNDFVSAGAGDDYMLGDDGDDTLDGGAGNDRFDGWNGWDTASYATAVKGVHVSLRDGKAYEDGFGTQDELVRIEHIIGSAYNDRLIGDNLYSNNLTGGAGHDTLEGGGGDILDGGTGNDTYYVRTGDRVIEAAGSGNDTVIAAASYHLRTDAQVEILKLAGIASKVTASLTGSNSANTLQGHGGKNTLKGLGGNDILKGLGGNDVLYGGAGKDKFVFNSKPNKKTNLDKIMDFSVKDDTIWLDNAIFKKLGKKGTEMKPGKLNKAFFTIGDKAKDKNDYIIYDKKKGVLYYDADGSGKGAATAFATIKKGLKMTYLDFQVI